MQLSGGNSTRALISLILTLLIAGCGGGGSSSSSGSPATPAPAPPKILEFSATPSSLYGGGNVQLTINFSGDSANLMPGSETFQAPVTLNVWLTQSQDFQLNVYRAGAVITGTLHVDVLPSLTSALKSFTCSPTLNFNGNTFQVMATYQEGSGFLNGQSLISGTTINMQLASPSVQTFQLEAAGMKETFETMCGPVQKGINFLAGYIGTDGNINGPARMARFDSPNHLAIDSTGRVFITEAGTLDNEQNRFRPLPSTIRLLSPDGTVSTYCGTVGQNSFKDGPREQALLDRPGCMVVDNGDNLWFFDNNGLRIIAPDGIVTTIVPANVLISAPGQRLSGMVSGACWDPKTKCILFSVSTSLVVIERFNTVTRILDTFTSDPLLLGCAGMAPLPSGHYIVANPASTQVLDIDEKGKVTTLYQGSCGDSGVFCAPISVVTDAEGKVFILTGGTGMVWQLGQTDGIYDVQWLGGNFRTGYCDGSILTGSMGGASEMILHNNSFIIDDTGDCAIRQMDMAGNFTTIAGMSMSRGADVNPWDAGALAWGLTVRAMAVDPNGKILVGSEEGICQVSTTGGFQQIVQGCGYDVSIASVDGPPGLASVRAINCMLFRPDGSLLFVEEDNKLRSMDPQGKVTTEYTWYTGYQDGPAGSFKLGRVNQIALTSTGEVLVCDTDNWCIRRLGTDGSMDTLFGKPPSQGGTILPSGIALAPDGTMFVPDYANCVIYKIPPGGSPVILSGQFGQTGTQDGNASIALFHQLGAAFLDPQGNLWVIDKDCFRKITPDGSVTTPIGSFVNYGVSLGPLPGSLRLPSGLAWLPNGDEILSGTFYLLYISN